MLVNAQLKINSSSNIGIRMLLFTTERNVINGTTSIYGNLTLHGTIKSAVTIKKCRTKTEIVYVSSGAANHNN
jgi:hypothetical protein